MSFMQAIDNFDKISNNPNVSEEVKEYAEAMRRIFIGIEQTKIQFDLALDELTGKEIKLK